MNILKSALAFSSGPTPEDDGSQSQERQHTPAEIDLQAWRNHQSLVPQHSHAEQSPDTDCPLHLTEHVQPGEERPQRDDVTATGSFHGVQRTPGMDKPYYSGLDLDEQDRPPSPELALSASQESTREEQAHTEKHYDSELDLRENEPLPSSETDHSPDQITTHDEQETGKPYVSELDLTENDRQLSPTQDQSANHDMRSTSKDEKAEKLYDSELDLTENDRHPFPELALTTNQEPAKDEQQETDKHYQSELDLSENDRQVPSASGVSDEEIQAISFSYTSHTSANGQDKATPFQGRVDLSNVQCKKKWGKGERRRHRPTEIKHTSSNIAVVYNSLLDVHIRPLN